MILKRDRTMKISIIFLLFVVIMVGGCNTIPSTTVPTPNTPVPQPIGGQSLTASDNSSYQSDEAQKRMDMFRKNVGKTVGLTLIKEFYNNFEQFRNTINIALLKNRSPDKDAKKQPFSEREVASFYFDSFRVLNDFAALKDQSYFPQQLHSPIKLVILESQAQGFKDSIKIDEEGYAIINQENVSDNQRLEQESRTGTGKQQDEYSRLHDLFVIGPVTKGVKDKDGKLYVGYLRKANNTSIEYFKQGTEFEKTDKSFPYVLFEAVNEDNEEAKENTKEGAKVISISYFFKPIELTQIRTFFLGKNQESFQLVLVNKEDSEGKLETQYSIFVDDEDKEKLLKKQTQDKYVLLIALPNEDDVLRDNHDVLDKVYELFQETFQNVILVSASSFKTFSEKEEKAKDKQITEDFSFGNSKYYTHTRPYLGKKGIEFFTVLADYNISPTSPSSEREGIDLESTALATSFATPTLAAVVFNMLSLSPKLSSRQVKDILKSGALNYGSPSIAEVGYVVNPTKSYRLAIGSLIANAQSDHYGCDGRIVLLDEGEEKWLIDCHNSLQLGKNLVDYKYSDSMSAFYKKARVHKSSLGSEFSGIVQITENTTPSYNPEKIIIKILEGGVEYKEKEIVVKFEKQFCSPEYSDKTTKTMWIDYSDREKHTGIPYLKKELVVETSPLTCQL